MTAETVTVTREIEEDETVTYCDQCGEAEVDEKGPLIEYIPDTAGVDIAPQSDIPTIHFHPGCVTAAEDLLLIDRGDEQWLEKDELLRWVTWAFAGGVVGGVLATLFIIGWVDILGLVVWGAGTLAATASTLPIPSGLPLAVCLLVVCYVVLRIGPGRIG
jgi:hypothetical protein